MRNGGIVSRPEDGAASAPRGYPWTRLRGAFYLPRNAWILTATATIWSIGGAMSTPFQSLYFYDLDHRRSPSAGFAGPGARIK